RGPEASLRLVRYTELCAGLLPPMNSHNRRRRTSPVSFSPYAQIVSPGSRDQKAPQHSTFSAARFAAGQKEILSEDRPCRQETDVTDSSLLCVGRQEIQGVSSTDTAVQRLPKAILAI